MHSSEGVPSPTWLGGAGFEVREFNAPMASVIPIRSLVTGLSTLPPGGPTEVEGTST